MLQRDYIMRLIREFLAALERILNRKDAKLKQEEIRELYNKYIGPYAFYRIATIDDVMKALAGIPEPDRYMKMEMLATLYFHEADLISNPDRDLLFHKAFFLFDYLEHASKTFSLDRRKKLNDIKQKLNVEIDAEKE